MGDLQPRGWFAALQGEEADAVVHAAIAREQISEQQVIDDSKRLEEIAARQRQACALLDAGRVG